MFINKKRQFALNVDNSDTVIQKNFEIKSNNMFEMSSKC